jgi:hypothetical protein
MTEPMSTEPMSTEPMSTEPMSTEPTAGFEPATRCLQIRVAIEFSSKF